MDDTTLIASVYPYEDDTGKAMKAIQSSTYYVAPPLKKLDDDEHSRHAGDGKEYDYTPRLDLRFDGKSRGPHGFTIGSDKSNDIVLNYKGVSFHHVSITFDGKNRLIIKDWGSLQGTKVAYDGEADQYRSTFQWIISGHPFLKRISNVILAVGQTALFRIVVAPRDINSPEYDAQVQQFMTNTTSADDLFEGLALAKGVETEKPTGVHTPETGVLYLKQQLGSGGFGVVKRFWDVSSGEEFAIKRPTDEAIQKDLVVKEMWLEETRIMRKINHEYVLRLIKSTTSPCPALKLEYMPYGSLDEHRNLSYSETVRVMHQCLSGLAHLHQQSPPIIHRDIKPANILVKNRSNNSIHIKLADFGLATDSRATSYCGTPKYMAPEVYDAGVDEPPHSYTTAVDIWSLGVTIFRLSSKLPKLKSDQGPQGGRAWCQLVIKTVEDACRHDGNQLRYIILDRMIKMRPELRWPAHTCRDEVASLIPMAILQDAARAIGAPPTPDYKEHTNEEPATYRWNPQVGDPGRETIEQMADPVDGDRSDDVCGDTEPNTDPYRGGRQPDATEEMEVDENLARDERHDENKDCHGHQGHVQHQGPSHRQDYGEHYQQQGYHYAQDYYQHQRYFQYQPSYQQGDNQDNDAEDERELPTIKRAVENTTPIPGSGHTDIERR